MLARSIGSTDRMTAGATIHEQFLSWIFARHGDKWSCSALGLPPFLENLGTFCNNLQTHVSMADAAKLGALPQIYAGLIGLDPLLICQPRNHLCFSAERRHPKGVNDICTFQLDKNRLAHRNV